MKKLLVILLLLFPVHGAWAVGYEFFGIKTGEKIQKYKTDYKIDGPSGEVFGSTWGQIGGIHLDSKNINEVPVSNKHFDKYSVQITPLTGLIYAIGAEGKMEQNARSDKLCIETVKKIGNIISNKYSIKLQVHKKPHFQNSDIERQFQYSIMNEKIRIYIGCDTWAGNGYSKYFWSIKFHYTDFEIRKKDDEELYQITKERRKKEEEERKKVIRDIIKEIDTRGF